MSDLTTRIRQNLMLEAAIDNADAVDKLIKVGPVTPAVIRSRQFTDWFDAGEVVLAAPVTDASPIKILIAFSRKQCKLVRVPAEKIQPLA